MMAVLSKSSDKEVERLCNDVCVQVTDSSYKNGSDSLSRLRLICGKNECGCGAQPLSYLLQVQGEKTVDLSVGLSIIRNYSSLARDQRCQTVLERLLRLSLTDSPSGSTIHFLDRLWNFYGLKSFTISLVEDFLRIKSNYVEEDIFDVFEESLQGVNPDCVWADDKFDRLVYWSSNSPRIFCTVTGVLNSWLQRIVGTIGQYETCVSVVTSFVNRVRIKCKENQRDFVLLYPAEFHSVVSLLDIRPSVFPKIAAHVGSLTLTTVVALLRQSLEKKPVQTLCILTHFPEWSYFIDR